MSSHQADLLPEVKQKNYLTSFYHTKNILNDLLKKEGVTVELDETIIFIIIQEYKKHLKCLKTTMNALGGKDRVDSHKVAALFLMLIVKHSNVVKATSKISSNTTFNTIPYIYFAFVYGVVVMEAIYNINRAEKQIFNIHMSYAKEFVKLIYANRDIVTIPVNIPRCGKEFNGIFLLSHLFYFIEKVAEKRTDIV